MNAHHNSHQPVKIYPTLHGTCPYPGFSRELGRVGRGNVPFRWDMWSFRSHLGTWARVYQLLILVMVILPLKRNPYNGYINPYWLDDHPLLYMEMSWELIDPAWHLFNVTKIVTDRHPNKIPWPSRTSRKSSQGPGDSWMSRVPGSWMDQWWVRINGLVITYL